MNGSHKTFNNTEVIVDYFSQRRKAVGGAGCVGHNLHILSIFVKIYSAHKGRRFLILCGRGYNNLLSAAVKVCARLFRRAEHAGRLYDIFCSAGLPIDSRRILLGKEYNLLAVYYQRVSVDLNRSVKLTVNRVVLKHVSGIRHVDKRIVYAYDSHILSVKASSEYQAADSAETVDTNFYHKNLSSKNSILRFARTRLVRHYI